MTVDYVSIMQTINEKMKTKRPKFLTIAINQSNIN